MNSETKTKLNILNDNELEAGIWEIGAHYYIRTPSYHYTGTLVGVTSSVFVLEDSATVFESGAFPQFFAGKGKGTDEQKHAGAGRLIVDRAGASALVFLTR